MRATLTLQPGIQHISKPVTHKINRNDRHQKRYTRKNSDPIMTCVDIVETIRNETPKRRLGLLHTQPQKGQGRFQRDGVGGLHCANHNDRCNNVWKQMIHQNAPL